MDFKTIEFNVAGEHDGIKAGVFLKRVCGISARTLAKLKRVENGITRNGELLKTIDFLYNGDVIKLRLPRDSSKIVPVKGELDILYEDDYIIAINKGSDTPVHPTKVHQTDTLANYLAYRQLEIGESYTFRAINRIDKDTTGIVVIAKDRFSATAVFNTISKTYKAICEGVITESGTIDKPILLLEGHSIQRTVGADGAPSITHYKPVLSNREHTLLDIKLETGRTHQIRCHMASIGHPLAGDDMYGGSLKYIKRQALHCNSVSFVHPVSKERIELSSDIPEDMQRII